MKINKKIFFSFLFIHLCFGQNLNSSVLYQKAINTVDGDKALALYDQIIQMNDKSDYYWLSVLKKAELNYAIGSYITSSNLLKEFNLNAPGHLVTDISKSLLYQALTASGDNKTAKEYKKKLSKPVVSKKIKENNVWFIQFGAFQNKENATILKETLNETGISDIQVNQVFNRGKTTYYVRSKAFTSYTSASKKAAQLRKYDDFTFAIVGY
ncbi:MAG: SPOR domain-containing protein [Candidatus Neomarinimicrobiota bacterium]|nr:SPOR domain-containing protein [Candidatus Neomarinimicrobiota bacterium]